MNKKATGSFYTPEPLVTHMVNYAVNKKQVLSVLEPSMGDGRFINELSKLDLSVKGIEFDKEKVQNYNTNNKNITVE